MVISRKNFYMIFYTCFTIYWFISYILQSLPYDFSVISKIFIGIGVIAFFIEWIMTKFTFKEYCVQFLFLIFLIYVYIKSGMTNEGVLSFFPAIVELKNIKIRDVTKVMFRVLFILEVLLLVAAILKIIPTTTYTKTDLFGNSYTMIEIALMHGNSNYIIIFNIISLYLYTYFDNLNLKKCLVLQFLLIFFYLLFYSKTGFILGTFVVWGCLLIKKNNNNKNNNKYNKNSFSSIIIGHFFLFFYTFVYIMATFLHNTKFFYFLNKVVQSRIYEAYYHINKNGISFFPRNIKYYYICDNSQTILLVSFGVIFTLLYVFLNDKAIRNLLNNSKNVEVFFILVYLLYSYSEITFIKPFSNFSVLFLIYAFYKEKVMDSNEKNE